MKVKYIGPHDRHTIRTEDLAHHGVDGFETVTWDLKDNQVLEVSDAAGQKLIELMPSSFEEASDDDDAPSGRSSNVTGSPSSPSSSGKAIRNDDVVAGTVAP